MNTLVLNIVLGLYDVINKHKKMLAREVISEIFKSYNLCKFTNNSNFVSVRFIQGKLVMTNRKYHVKDEKFNIIETNYKPRIGKLIVQYHQASHNHFDISIIDNNVEIFRGAVTKTELSNLFPKTTKESTAFVRQPQHVVEYTTKTPDKFTIKEGYGAGTVERVLNVPIEIFKTESGKISFSIYEKDYSGRYSLQDRNSHWQCIRKLDLNPAISGRGNFKAITGDNNSRDLTVKMRNKINKFTNNHAFIIEEKYRGANNYLSLNKDGNKIWSHRLGKNDGKNIYHEDQYNEIRDELHPELDGTIVRGELLYIDGKAIRIDNKYLKTNGKQLENIISKFSHIKNPIESRDLRKKEGGEIAFVIWDINKYKGNNVENLTYAEKLVYINNIVSKSKYLYSPRRYNDLDTAWKEVVLKDKGEGLVVKLLHKISPQPNKKGTGYWLKIKDKDFIDARIIDWKPTIKITGEVNDSMVGEFTVQDDSGKKFSCPATGMSHEQRKWTRNNIDKILNDNSIIMVKHEGVTDKAVLKPVFSGVHMEKSDGIILNIPERK